MKCRYEERLTIDFQSIASVCGSCSSDKSVSLSGFLQITSRDGEHPCDRLTLFPNTSEACSGFALSRFCARLGANGKSHTGKITGVALKLYFCNQVVMNLNAEMSHHSICDIVFIAELFFYIKNDHIICRSGCIQHVINAFFPGNAINGILNLLQ